MILAQNWYLKPYTNLSDFLWAVFEFWSNFLHLKILEAFFFSPCKYQNSYSMTGESLICVKLLHYVLSKDITCFSPWMRKRKWEVELPEVCLQTWKEGVKCCVRPGGIRKAVLYPVLRAEILWSSPRGRDVCFWSAGLSFYLSCSHQALSR